MVDDDLGPHRKRIRLDASSYSVPGTVFLVTVCCRDHDPLLDSPDLAEVVRATLMDPAFTTTCELYAFAIMPDHVHILVGVACTSLVKVMEAWKSRSTRALWKHGHSGPAWQRSFHDHGLRRAESIQAAAEYVVANPERAGIAGRDRFVWHRWMSRSHP